jgi:hypothetical protein
MIKHRSKSTSMVAEGRGDGFTFNDIKKSLNINGNDGGKKNGAAGKTSNKEGTDGRVFTPDEDAKIIANKAANKSWAETAAELGGTSKGEVGARYREITSNNGNNDNKDDAKKRDAGKDKGKKDDVKKADPKKDDAKKNEQGDSTPFTADENAKIRELMGQGMGAAKIAHNMDGRTRAEVGKRIGELKKQDGDAGGNTKGDDEPKEGAQKDNSKSDDTKGKDKKRNKSSNKQESKPKAGKPASVAGSAYSEVKFTMGEWLTLQEDDEFTFRELQFLSELIGKHPDWSWLQIASRFADKMDRRVHPEDIREKFLQMAAAA